MVQDDLSQARQQATQIKKSVSGTSMRLSSGDAHNKWMDYEKSITMQLELFLKSKKIEESRKVFIELSNTLIELVTDFGPFEKALFVQRCPMTNQNQGAEWLSFSKEIIVVR